MTKMTATMAIKTFFEMSPKEAIAEIKNLSPEDKAELGALCAKALGVEIGKPPAKDD